jgi:predicted adenylyl cyclase CyaB
MLANIEIKARVRDLNALRDRVANFCDMPPQIILQEDTFFNMPKGRLKLRILAAGHAQLIYYDRPDQAGPKHCSYHIFETNDPEDLETVLSMALGIRSILRKTRHLYIIGQTRIHLDDVAGLGHFVELEVVLQPGQSDAEGQEIARSLMTKLDIQDEDLIEGAYVDLLEAACPT